MPRPKQPIKTQNAFGVKMNTILALKGMEGDYKALADVFGVSVPSARQWIESGRVSKDHYATLVQWSGRDLHWWFDVPAPLDHSAAESKPLALHAQPAWPFRRVSPADYERLDEYERGQVEGLVQALLIQSQAHRQAAA